MLSSLLARVHQPIYQHRLTVLASLLAPHLRGGDRVLDVGCGSGQLGAALLARSGSVPGLVVEGLETKPRGGELIPTTAYDGRSLPFDDGSWDVVILADVLHHEPDADRLLGECARVTRRLLVIKDHRVEGKLGYWIVCLLDWAANRPYGVPCLYRYNSLSQWHAIFSRHRLRVVEERDRIDLYPGFWNLVFGRGRQYFAALEPERHAA